MRENDELTVRLRELRPPASTPGLRDRVLAAATGALPARAPTWSDRLWLSRPLRVAWASAIIVLLTLLAVSDRSVDRIMDQSFGRVEAGERPQVAALARELAVRTIWEYRPTTWAPPRRGGRAAAAEEMR